MKHLFHLFVLCFFSFHVLDAQQKLDHNSIQGVPIIEWDAQFSGNTDAPTLIKHENPNPRKSNFPFKKFSSTSLNLDTSIPNISLEKRNVLFNEKVFSDLELVPNVYRSPYRYNVYVLMEDRQGNRYQCSGVLVDPKVVLMTGNCVYDQDFFGGFARNIRVIPAYYDGEDDLFGYAEYTKIHTYKEWRDDRDVRHNIAYLELDRPIGATLDWLQFDEEDINRFYFDKESNSNFSTKTYINESYPKEENLDSGRLYTRSGKINLVEQYAVFHEGVLFPGQAGGPLYSSVFSANKISGILSHRKGNRAGYVRITDKKTSDIQEVIDEITPTTPDLYPLAAPAFPSFINRQENSGASLDTLIIGVANYSETSFTGDIVWGVVLSEDDEISSDDEVIGGLRVRDFTLLPKEGQFFNGANFLSIPPNLPEGNYYIGYFLDVEDSNQSNNLPVVGDMKPIVIGNPSIDPCTTTPLLECGVNSSFTTVGADNTFIYENYEGICTERIGAAGNSFDGPDQFFRFEAVSPQDVKISMTGLSEDLDLFLFQSCEDGTLSECLTRSISFGTADETIELKNALGTYYLVVDGYQAGEESDFSLSLSCTSFTSSDTAKPTICEIPADFINNAVNKIKNLSLDSGDLKLNSIEIDENIAADFSTTPPDNVVFDAFIFFQSEESTTDFFGLNTRTVFDEDNPDRPNPKIYVYTCECENEDCGPKFEGKSNDSDNFNLDFAPPGFYYIVIVGEADNLYDMALIPEGPCEENVESYFLNTIVEGNLSFENNQFDRVDSEYDIFSCYDGNRTYEGADRIYQIRIEETQKTTFRLTSLTESGMFLYDFLCGGDCIASAENLGDNTTAVIDTVYLTPGIYHLVIDQVRETELGQFILSSQSEVSELPFYLDFEILFCTEETIGDYNIVLSENLKNTFLGNNKISEDFEFLLYSEERSYRSFGSRNSYYPYYFPFKDNYNLKLPVSPQRDSSCFYVENERLKMKVHNTTKGGVYDTDIIFQTTSGQTTDSRVDTGKTSIVTGFNEIGNGTGKFVVNNSTIVFPRFGGSRFFFVQADADTKWRLSKSSKKIGSTIDINPVFLNTEFRGTKAIKVEVSPNQSDRLNILGLNIVSSDGFYQSVTIYQLGKIGFAVQNPLLTEIENLEKRIKIYPNPVSTNFQVEVPIEVNHIDHIAFYDALGKQIPLAHQTASNYRLEIDASQTPRGIYFMQIRFGEKIVTKKIIIAD